MPVGCAKDAKISLLGAPDAHTRNQALKTKPDMVKRFLGRAPSNEAFFQEITGRR